MQETTLMLALQAVQAASLICRQVQAQLVTDDTLEKKDRSPVTVADFASQAIIGQSLRAAGVNDPIVGEENADALRQPAQAALSAAVVDQVRQVHAEAQADQVLDWIDRAHWQPDGQCLRYWTLDPIDGTKGFLRGEQYAVALALIEDGQVQLGVLGCPNLDGPDGQPGTLLAAIAGQGAWQWPLEADLPRTMRVAITVDDVSDPAQARFCESVESGHSKQDDAARIAEQLGITNPPLRMDSQAKYAAVARGEASIYLRLPTSSDYHEKIWDHAAGMLVVQEAGGRVSDLHGRPLDFSRGAALAANRGVIATNGRLHRSILDAAAALGLS